MNLQRFAGLAVVGLTNGIIYSLTGDWRVSALTIIAGIGGLIYGDAK